MSNTQHDKQHNIQICQIHNMTSRIHNIYITNMLNTQHDKLHNIQICQIHNMTSNITSKYVKYTT